MPRRSTRRKSSTPPVTARSRSLSAPAPIGSLSTSRTATSRCRASTTTEDGYGGKRTAYLDEILFIPVPDVAVRLAGIETGEYHFGQEIQQDQYDRVKGMKGVEARIIKPANWSTAGVNPK